jgi:hypothetical protein
LVLTDDETGTYDPETNQTIWGVGNLVPEFDPTVRPDDNLFTNSAVSSSGAHQIETAVGTGQLTRPHPLPRRAGDYDAAGRRIT